MVNITYVLVIFTIAIHSTLAKDVNLKYTTVSYTLHGKPCINDCVNSKCFVDRELNEEDCKYSDLPAPTYYTSLSHSLKIPTCLSRCGKLTRGPYEECFISDKDVDNCGAVVQNKWFSNVTQIKPDTPSIFFEMNADNCELHGYSDMCIDAQGIVQESDLNKPYRIMQSPTIIASEIKCDEECKIRTHDHMECANAFSKLHGKAYVVCTPLAQSPQLEKFFKVIPMDGCSNSIDNQSIATIHNSSIIEVAVKLQNSNYFSNIIFRDNRNPIHNCTVKPSANYGDPVLPLVIRAKITQETIRPFSLHRREEKIPSIVTKNLERMESLVSDKPKTLIGYQLGSPTVMCNVVPLLPSLTEALKSFETEIYNWVNENDDTQSDLDVRGAKQQDDPATMNSVDMTVVVMYEDTSRPSAIGVDITYFKGDVEAKERRINNILCNLQDPKQKTFIMSILEKYCGKNFPFNTNTVFS